MLLLLILNLNKFILRKFKYSTVIYDWLTVLPEVHGPLEQVDGDGPADVEEVGSDLLQRVDVRHQPPVAHVAQRQWPLQHLEQLRPDGDLWPQVHRLSRCPPQPAWFLQEQEGAELALELDSEIRSY